jgi:hypothetical protein
MDKIISFFSIFQNANISQKMGSVVTLALGAAITLYEILPRVIQALRALSGAMGGDVIPPQ